MSIPIDSLLVDWGTCAFLAVLFIYSLLSGWSWFFFVCIAAIIVIPLRFLFPIPTQNKQKGIAIITGGSTGIGRALGSVLAGAHYDLILVARSEKELKLAQTQIKEQYGVEVHIISKDLSTPTAGQDLFDEIKAMGVMDKVSVLINNAGFGSVGSFLSTPLSSITSQIGVNLHTLTVLSHLFGNQFKLQGGGKILQISSTAGFQPGPNMAVYYATKAFVTSLSESLSYELRGSGVTVSTLCPGPVLSAFGARSGNDTAPLFKYGTKFGAVATPEATALAGWSGLLRGDRLIIPGPNLITVYFSRIMPRSLVLIMSNFMNSGTSPH